ncbi:MAG TPA: TerC/Alx family metal homeostasis membrane protein [Dehalococcoidia bacterium]|nr:TerC/Alx family metal homeostasis membrane protein [Dehalococcoidia bacterium]
MLETFNHWLIFNAVLVALLIFDLLILTRKSRVVGMKEAAWLTAFWTFVAGAVGVWIFVAGSEQQGGEYFAGYVAERALSIDNLFVFIVIFGYFSLPKSYEARGLLFGIVGALLARAVFIAAGVAVISAFAWFLYVLGAFLIYTAYKLAFVGDHEVNPGKNIAVRLFRKLMPVSDEFDGTKFFTRMNGVRAATPFLLVIIVLATTDVVFAIDSIPTVFGITDDPFIVWSSNAMAVLGMRPLFFLLVGMVKLFRYLQFGLAAILGFVGLKMIVETAFEDFHVIGKLEDIYLSLVIILGILIGSVLLSIILPDDDDDIDENPLHVVGSTETDN